MVVDWPKVKRQPGGNGRGVGRVDANLSNNRARCDINDGSPSCDRSSSLHKHCANDPRGVSMKHAVLRREPCLKAIKLLLRLIMRRLRGEKLRASRKPPFQPLLRHFQRLG